jgi:List-Bact-rpt repeat protein/PASTA domain-containing protein
LRAVVPLAAVAAVLVVAVGPAQAYTTFVQDQRANSLTLRFSTDSFAPNNAFGAAFVGSTVQSQITTALGNGIKDGSISWMFEMRDLTDLTGTNDASFHIGVLNPAPVAGTGYDGTSDLDWWYLPDASELNSDGSPKQQLAASFATKTLSAGPGAADLGISLLGEPMTLAMSNVQIHAVAGVSSGPTASSGGPPGHLASEYLDPSLQSFGSMTGGKLSGNISARSLYNAPVPSSLTGTTCNGFYTTANTILDVLTNGCKAFGALVNEVNATSPDTVTSVGSGTYSFTVNSSHQVTGCTHNSVPDTLSDCLDGAAYSAYFQFTTDRVIDQLQMAEGKLLTVNTAGPAAGSGVVRGPFIDCPGDCTEPYDAGTQVTLTAFGPFTGWTGCDNPSGTTCVMTMDADKQVSANFAVQHTLTVSKSGSGTGTVTSSPAGIQCGATCSGDFDEGTQVTLTATPAAGFGFAGWSGGGCTGTGTCKVTMDADTSVTATFVTLRKLTVTKGGSGSVSSSPAGIDCGATCAAQYDDGASVTLTATAAPGFHFAGWSGDCTGTGTCPLTMAADHAVTATFDADPVVVQCHVPNVKGKTLAKARRALTRANCRVGKIRKAHSARVKKGRVISQRPAPRTVLPNHAKVALKVSTGKKR